MRQSQRGVTLVGWICLLVPVAILVYAGIRLTPVYLNYMRVARSLEQFASENKADVSTGSPEMLRRQLEKHFDIESVEHPALKDVDIHRDADHWVAEANYEDLVPLFGNVSLLVQFDKRVEF
jgi:hypothetical protein